MFRPRLILKRGAAIIADCIILEGNDKTTKMSRKRLALTLCPAVSVPEHAAKGTCPLEPRIGFRLVRPANP